VWFFAGERILFAGTRAARAAQWPMLRNVNVRDYALRGVDLPGGWLWQKIRSATASRPH